MRPVRAAAGLVILAGVAYAGFRWGPLVFSRLEGVLGLSAPAPGSTDAGPPAPSPEIAEVTLDRFERFRGGEGQRRLALSGTELSSVVRYALPGLIPPGVSDPTISLHEGRVRLTARVAVAAFPRLPRLEEVMGLLPDTVLLDMEGALVPLDRRFLALVVDKVEASRVPIPRRMVADVLAGMGREGPPSLPADALAVPVPDGVTSVTVQGDSLVLEARR